jgi:hypothetical protein
MLKEDIVKLIKVRIEDGIKALDDKVATWLKGHFCTPRPIEAIINYELGTKKTFWLVTDHTGKDDAGKRIIYDADLDRFGLIMTTIQGSELFLGYHNNFADTVYAI